MESATEVTAQVWTVSSDMLGKHTGPQKVAQFSHTAWDDSSGKQGVPTLEKSLQGETVTSGQQSHQLSFPPFLSSGVWCCPTGMTAYFRLGV